MHSIQALLLLSSAFVATAQQTTWGQCGGKGWAGPFTCVAGTTCVYNNEWYSQCLPGAPTTSSSSSVVKTSSTTTSRSTTPSISSTTVRTSSTTLSTTRSTTLSTTSRTSSTSSATPSSTGKVRFAGVNMAGYDFGVDTLGTQNLGEIQTPDNAQMPHFVNDAGMNIFRLPTGWQFLVNNVLGGTLNPTNLARYDTLVQGCLATGAYCILDIHNYARWNNQIVGQGGPADSTLADVWRQLAVKYGSQSRIIFGIMNEPHDVPSITTWATTVQLCVNAIRNAGATSQMILLPGNGWSGAGAFISSGSLAALSAITNLDGSKTNLIFDVHKYLDTDGSGTHLECVTNNINDSFAPLAIALRNAGRQAMLTETGGGNSASCVKFMCEQLAFVNANSDVFLGYVGWSAGAFQPSWNYVLTLVPILNGNTWTDTLLMNSCFKR